MCENCGNKEAIKSFKIIFDDGINMIGREWCISDYFTEIPEQIVKVEAI